MKPLEVVRHSVGDGVAVGVNEDVVVDLVGAAEANGVVGGDASSSAKSNFRFFGWSRGAADG